VKKESEKTGDKNDSKKRLQDLKNRDIGETPKAVRL
jgi:hypothetical protein